MKQEIEDVDAWIEGIHVMTEDEAKWWRESLSPETLAIVDALSNSGNTYWNYRMVRELAPTGEFVYSIREAYYADNAVVMISAEPSAPIGETLEIVLNNLEMMAEALCKPVLDAETRTEVEPAHLTEQ